MMKLKTLALTLITGMACLVFGSAAAPAQPAVLAEACLVALDACSVSCHEIGDPQLSAGCLARCDLAAATCFDDEEVTLSSEDYLGKRTSGLFTKAAACHDTTPCPAEYGSCGSWSGFSDCGDPICGPSSLCQTCNEWGQCLLGPATKQRRERFRVCFNQQMEGCTEYQWATQTLSCGC